MCTFKTKNKAFQQYARITLDTQQFVMGASAEKGWMGTIFELKPERRLLNNLDRLEKIL
jgi:hypothetical protein